MEKEFSELENDLKRLAAEIEKMPEDQITRIAGTQAVKHSQKMFEREGFIGNGTFKPWDPKQSNPKNKKILQEQGHLKDNIDFWINGKEVYIGVDLGKVPYAKIHNEGGIIKVRITEKSRKFFWRQYKVTKDPNWKNMALSKKSFFTIRIPQRKYLEYTPEIGKAITRELGIRFDKLEKRIMR